MAPPLLRAGWFESTEGRLHYARFFQLFPGHNDYEIGRMLMPKLVSVAFFSVFIWVQCLVAAAAESELVSKGGPYTARSNQWESFPDVIRLNGGEEKVPLVFSFANAGFKQFRVFINGGR